MKFVIILKLMFFFAISIAGCEKPQTTKKIVVNEASSNEEAASEEFLRKFEESSSPNFSTEISQMSTAELHDYAENLNWDFGVGRVSEILDHPEVDKGTALMLYWRNQPTYQTKYESREAVPPTDRRRYDVHIKAEHILLSDNFKSYIYPFNFIQELFLCPEQAKRALADESIRQEFKIMDGPNMTDFQIEWCSSEQRQRSEKWRADNGYSYPYEDPYTDEKINKTMNE